MGKSKVRGGAKAHRKRVENRNQNIKTQQSAIQKLFSDYETSNGRVQEKTRI